MPTVLELSKPPDDFVEALKSNEAALKKLAAKLGGKSRALTSAERASWTVPKSPFEHTRVLDAEVKGARIAIVVNVVKSESSKSTVRWTARHLVAVRHAKAEVESVVDTLSIAAPSLGELRVPHFFYASNADAKAEHAWTLPSGHTMPKLEGFEVAGCYSGLLYAKCSTTALDSAAAERAIEALLEATALPWIAPTPEDREARRRASMVRGRVKGALTCGTVLLLLVASVAGLVYLATST